MNKILLGTCVFLLFSGAVAAAQHSMLGKYSGTFVKPTNHGDADVGLTLEISSVKGNAVEARAERFGRGGCVGDYPLAGTVKGDSLALAATRKGGAAGDCGMWLKLKVEGDKLVGTMNHKWPVQLAK